MKDDGGGAALAVGKTIATMTSGAAPTTIDQTMVRPLL